MVEKTKANPSHLTGGVSYLLLQSSRESIVLCLLNCIVAELTEFIDSAACSQEYILYTTKLGQLNGDYWIKLG